MYLKIIPLSVLSSYHFRCGKKFLEKGLFRRKVVLVLTSSISDTYRNRKVWLIWKTVVWWYSILYVLPSLLQSRGTDREAMDIMQLKFSISWKAYCNRRQSGLRGGFSLIMLISLFSIDTV